MYKKKRCRRDYSDATTNNLTVTMNDCYFSKENDNYKDLPQIYFTGKFLTMKLIYSDVPIIFIIRIMNTYIIKMILFFEIL